MKYQDLINNTKIQDKKLVKLVLVDYFNIKEEDIINNEIVNIDINKFNDIINRLLNDEPYQYIKGSTNFYGYNFKVNKHTLIPRYETELLVEEVIKYYDNSYNILDLCTGSGIIAITLSKELNIEVDASDISKEALIVAKKNNILLNTKVNFIESNLFENINNKYSIIVSNPPYIKIDEPLANNVKNYEPSLALYGGKEGLDYYEKILKDIKNYLKDKYAIFFEIGSTQAKDIINITNKYLKGSKQQIIKDYNNLDRIIIITNE